ncbi:MAG: hypothetical protein ACK40O_02745 [Allosphingosinicella sp.]
MPNRLTSLRFTALAGALVLAACGTGGAENGQNQAANDADPALTSALEDQILVDPGLAQQSNQNAVRTTETPNQAQYPAQGGGSPAAGAGAALAGGEAGCTAESQFDYGNGWAQRLPEAFPIIPGARIVEAAGNDKGGCRSRVVTFTTGENWERVLDWYHTRAVRAGYSSEQQIRDGDRILAGTAGDGGAFFLIVTPKQQGAEVALIVNNGR